MSEKQLVAGHQLFCYFLVWSLKTRRRWFILNCQIYHQQCRKGSDSVIKFTATPSNHSGLGNRCHHILTGDLLHKTQKSYKHMFFHYTLWFNIISGSHPKERKKKQMSPKEWLHCMTLNVSIDKSLFILSLTSSRKPGGNSGWYIKTKDGRAFVATGPKHLIRVQLLTDCHCV